MNQIYMSREACDTRFHEVTLILSKDVVRRSIQLNLGASVQANPVRPDADAASRSLAASSVSFQSRVHNQCSLNLLSSSQNIPYQMALSHFDPTSSRCF